VNALSTPQGSGAQQSETGQQQDATQNVVENLSTETQQVVQSIPADATGVPADAAAMPSNADTKRDLTLATDTAHDGDMAVPGKAGGNGTNSRDGLGGAIRSVGDRISSSISKITGGLTGGTKTGETSAGGTKAGESGTGGTKAGESGTGGKHRAE
jgi:hypothetical protein